MNASDEDFSSKTKARKRRANVNNTAIEVCAFDSLAATFLKNCAAIEFSRFFAILIGQPTPNVTSIVCEYSGSGFVVSKRDLEQQGRSIERNSIIREESEFGLLHLGVRFQAGREGRNGKLRRIGCCRVHSSKNERARK